MQYRYTAWNLYLAAATEIAAYDSTAAASANTAWKASDVAAASKAASATLVESLHCPPPLTTNFWKWRHARRMRR